MKKWNVIVTRDTTESTTLTVEAGSEMEAASVARAKSYEEPCRWRQDDTPNASSDHYTNGAEEVVEPVDEELVKFLDGCVGVAEATSEEYHGLWERLHNDDRGPQFSWEANLSGLGREVGRLADMPVYISLRTTKVKGHKILFYHATSQVVDHRMVRAWLEENMPATAFTGTNAANQRLNHTDATNFCNVLPRDRD